MKLTSMLVSACLVAPLISATACLDAPGEGEDVDAIEFDKNGKLGDRQVWLYAGKPVALTMQCDEWFSCDVKYWAKPCESWIEGTAIKPGAHLATIGAVEVCTPEGGCAKLNRSADFSYEAAKDTKLVDDSGYHMVINPATGELEYMYVSDYDVVELDTTHPVAQYFTLGDLDKEAKVTATIALPSNATAPVCMEVGGKYW